MNKDRLPSDPQLDKLFVAARAHRPDTTRAEYAFETRLAARLRSQKKPASAWASLSWRMIPFFSALVIGLFLWHGQIAVRAQEAEQMAYVENPEMSDLWNNFD